jgi:hypothetical protein
MAIYTWQGTAAALVAIMHRWERAPANADMSRYGAQREKLLERAATLPIGSPADAATALRVVLKATGDDDWDDPAHYGLIGQPEDTHRGNIIRNVQRYLAGEPVALAGRAAA